MNSASARYMEAVLALVREIAEAEGVAIARAAELVADVAAAGGIVHLFGSGHSQLLAQEGYYRAGGLACINPLLMPELTSTSGATTPMEATQAERNLLMADVVFMRFHLSPGDVLVVFSNSGVNAVPVEVARRAAADGVRVVAVVSRAYMASTASTHPEGLKLGDVAEFVIDNHGRPGDAAVEVPGARAPVGPTSAITGGLILHAITAEAVERLVARGIDPPVFLSSKLPGADAHNAALLERYRDRIPLLAGTAVSG